MRADIQNNNHPKRPKACIKQVVAGEQEEDQDDCECLMG